MAVHELGEPTQTSKTKYVALLVATVVIVALALSDRPSPTFNQELVQVSTKTSVNGDVSAEEMSTFLETEIKKIVKLAAEKNVQETKLQTAEQKKKFEALLRGKLEAQKEQDEVAFAKALQHRVSNALNDAEEAISQAIKTSVIQATHHTATPSQPEPVPAAAPEATTPEATTPEATTPEATTPEATPEATAEATPKATPKATKAAALTPEEFVQYLNELEKHREYFEQHHPGLYDQLTRDLREIAADAKAAHMKIEPVTPSVSKAELDKEIEDTVEKELTRYFQKFPVQAPTPATSEQPAPTHQPFLPTTPTTGKTLTSPKAPSSDDALVNTPAVKLIEQEIERELQKAQKQLGK